MKWRRASAKQVKSRDVYKDLFGLEMVMSAFYYVKGYDDYNKKLSDLWENPLTQSLVLAT